MSTKTKLCGVCMLLILGTPITTLASRQKTEEQKVTTVCPPMILGTDAQYKNQYKNMMSKYKYMTPVDQLYSKVKEERDRQEQEKRKRKQEMIKKQKEEENRRKQQEERKKKQSRLSRGGSLSTPSKIQYDMVATAYGAIEGGSGLNITCTGVTPVEGRTIAVDPNLIPLGSKVYIECPTYPSINGYYRAEDTGGAIKGNIIDVYFDDLNNPPEETNKRIDDFGRRNITIYVF